MNPIRASLRHREVTVVLTIFAVLLGIRALVSMPRREDPKITIRTGLVLAQYPGATAQQVEDQLTRKIEEELFRHAEVRKSKTFSTSRDGFVVVNVELEEAVKDPDRFWAMLRHDLNELRAIDLPPTVRGPIVNANFGDVVAVLLAVRGDRYTPGELRGYMDRIEDAIRTVPGVSKINRDGEQREQLRVTTTNASLAQFGVTPSQVVSAIRSRNAVRDAGVVDVGTGDRVPLRATGLFEQPAELERLLVATSRDGRPVYLGDFASVERRLEDPSYLVHVDGHDAALLSVEMQEGRNIVSFGNAVRAKLAEVRAALPSDLHVDLIADQPAAVQDRMLGFGREFLITLTAVILVTVLLLPLRIAAVAAVAIPVTVAITLAILSAVGIELHQVTFAGLVVALGIVVDDAIVVADNYVEKLDHGTSPFESAWRAPTELAVPVLAATLTIVASFLPIAWLPGAPGEFIRAMSFTVAIALTVSFVVAMFLTPLLALAFVKTGLHQGATQESAAKDPSPRNAAGRLVEAMRRFRPLDAMQALYERVMSVAMPRKRLTLVGAAAAFAAGVALLSAVSYRFFPLNERDQFIVDVWMPAGTRVEGTNAVVRQLEAELRRTDGVRSTASYVGAGAPRFYYNLDPEPPTPNYGELVVTTNSPEMTTEIIRHLYRRLDGVAPDAWVYVKALQQGPAIPAPIEVRLVGDDPRALRAWGDSVSRILERTPGSAYVHTDWRDDELGLAVHMRNEVAGRLGITEADVASQLAVGFDGAPVSTYWEGKRDLDITVRLDESERTKLDDVGAAYVIAPATGARVPLRQVADVAPEWRPSRIVHRNGVRTLTVSSFSAPDVLPSVVLEAATPRLAALHLPAGVRMEQGGEVEGAAEVQGAVNVALLTSMIGVFLILLFLFRNARQPLVVMVSIPLALVGAALGLVMTHNPFTYTANLGINALSGMVVRNAIILVEHANELRLPGMDIEAAALLAGRRRLRPIFLTTMAAALGVMPMILSGSPLWSPMASVIAVGLTVSMIFTLVVVPVLYVVVERRVERRAARRAAMDERDGGAPFVPRPAPAVATLGALALIVAMALPATVRAQAAQRLTLDEAVDLAVRRSTATRVAAARVTGAAAHERAAGADYLPQLALSGNRLQGTGRTTIVIPEGVLGNDGTGTPVPGTDRRFEQGATSLTIGQASLTQPVTQLYRIRQAKQLAAAQRRGAEADRTTAERDVALATERLYVGVLIARARTRAAEVSLAARRRQLVDAEATLRAGTAVRAQANGAWASALEGEYTLVTARNDADDLEAELRDLLALPSNVALDLVPPEADTAALRPLADYRAIAAANRPEIAAAVAQSEQAQRAQALAHADYIPDIGVGVTYTYQNGVAFLPQSSASLSIQGSWTVWDFGKRASVGRERAAQAEAASLALAHARDRAMVDVEKAYRRAERATSAAASARAAYDARRDVLRIAVDQQGRGIVPVANRAEAEAALAAAESQVVEVELGARLARSELARAAGMPR
ncbi:MAG TPA: efflux RND transporter permease subunit [Gemmatimonadaceae bacterium]